MHIYIYIYIIRVKYSSETLKNVRCSLCLCLYLIRDVRLSMFCNIVVLRFHEYVQRAQRNIFTIILVTPVLHNISCDDIFIISFISLFDKQSQIVTFLRETISQAQNKGHYSFRNIQICFIYLNKTDSLCFMLGKDWLS